MYSLKVVSSGINNSTAEALYFEQVVINAREAILGITAEAAWALCEYLDSVDANDIVMDKELYSQAVASVGGYLWANQGPVAQALAQKSWAAMTLNELVESAGDRYFELRPRLVSVG